MKLIIRKEWLISFYAYYGYIVLLYRLFFTSFFYPVLDCSNPLLEFIPGRGCLIGAFFMGLITYQFSYHKKGTKWLIFFIVFSFIVLSLIFLCISGLLVFLMLAKHDIGSWLLFREVLKLFVTLKVKIIIDVLLIGLGVWGWFLKNCFALLSYNRKEKLRAT